MSFDDVVHQRVRLRVCAMLDAATEVDFATLEASLGISTSLLSKQLKVLTDAGYVQLERRKQLVGRPRTWVRLTRAGRAAYRGHVAALREIVGEQ